MIGETQSTLASSAPIAQSSNNSLEADDLSRIWAENIKTPSNSSASKIKIDGTAFVADDLDIDGKGANVNISGNYIGLVTRVTLQLQPLMIMLHLLLSCSTVKMLILI